jgi:hypothetical protein
VCTNNGFNIILKIYYDYFQSLIIANVSKVSLTNFKKLLFNHRLENSKQTSLFFDNILSLWLFLCSSVDSTMKCLLSPLVVIAVAVVAAVIAVAVVVAVVAAVIAVTVVAAVADLPPLRHPEDLLPDERKFWPNLGCNEAIHTPGKKRKVNILSS